MTNSEKALSRRTFVKGSALAGLGAATVGTASLFGCAPSTGTEGDLAATGEGAAPEEKVCWGHCATNCECRCALRFHVVDDEVAWVESDNTGNDEYGDHQLRACQRGRSIRRWINHPDRLNVPLKRVGARGEGKFEEITWDEAIDTIATEYSRILKEYGPEAVYIHYASGVQDSNIRNFVKRLAIVNGGYLNYYGSYSSGQIGQAMPFVYGKRAGNGVSDVAKSEMVVLFGDNSCETKMSGGGPTYHYMKGLETSGAKVVVIDPRYTETVAAHADQWIPIRPGTDAALVDACAYVMITEDLVDHDFLSTYCVGYDDATMPEELRGQGASYVDYITGKGADKTAKTPEWASAITLVPADTIATLAREIAAAKPCAIYQGKGPQRRGNGEQTARAICMLPILTGNVGIEGGNSGGDLDSFYMPSKHSVPMDDNPVETSISVFTWIDAVDRGTELTAKRDGVRGKEKLDVPIKLILSYAGNCLTNQHSDINRTHDILADDTRPSSTSSFARALSLPLHLQQHVAVQVLDAAAQHTAVLHVHLRDGAAELAAGAEYCAGAQVQARRPRLGAHDQLGHVGVAVHDDVGDGVARPQAAGRPAAHTPHIPGLVTHEELHPADDRPCEVAHGAAVLVEVVVAEHRRHRRQRFQLMQDGRAADVPGVDDMVAIGQGRVGLGAQTAVGVGNNANAHGTSCSAACLPILSLLGERPRASPRSAALLRSHVRPSRLSSFLKKPFLCNKLQFVDIRRDILR